MIPAEGLVAPSGYAITKTKSAASSIEANILRPVMRYPPWARRARAFQWPLADQRRGDRLGKVAGDQLALAHDKLSNALLGLGRNLNTFQERHHDRCMHVEGERRRRTSLGEHLIGERVIEKARAGPAPFPADRQSQEPFLAQAHVIFDRMARVAVVRRRARSEIDRQLSAFVPQALLFGGELKIQASDPFADRVRP